MKTQMMLATLGATTAFAGLLPFHKYNSTMKPVESNHKEPTLVRRSPYTPLAPKIPAGHASNSTKTESLLERSAPSYQKTVCDFEPTDPKLYAGIDGVLAKNGGPAVPIYDGYCGLHWDEFSAGGPAPVNGLYANGKGYAIAQDTSGSSLSSDLSKKTGPFMPNSVAIGCFLATKTGLSPAIKCSIRVVPEGPLNHFYPPYHTCEFKTTSAADTDVLGEVATGVGSKLFNTVGLGLGSVQGCKLPNWTDATKLTFSLEESLLPDLSGVSGELGLSGAPGTVGFVIDDLVYSKELIGPKGKNAEVKE